MNLDSPIKTIENLQSQIKQGNLSVTDIVKQSLFRIHDPSGQGKFCFNATFDEAALSLSLIHI